MYINCTGVLLHPASASLDLDKNNKYKIACHRNGTRVATAIIRGSRSDPRWQLPGDRAASYQAEANVAACDLGLESADSADAPLSLCLRSPAKSSS